MNQDCRRSLRICDRLCIDQGSPPGALVDRAGQCFQLHRRKSAGQILRHVIHSVHGKIGQPLQASGRGVQKVGSEKSSSGIPSPCLNSLVLYGTVTVAGMANENPSGSTDSPFSKKRSFRLAWRSQEFRDIDLSYHLVGLQPGC